jgi:hypothetical protein
MSWYEASTFFVVVSTVAVLVVQVLVTWLTSAGTKSGYKDPYKLLSSELVEPPSQRVDTDYPCTLPESHFVAGLDFCETKPTKTEKLECYDRCRQNSQALRAGLYPNIDRRVAELWGS